MSEPHLDAPGEVHFFANEQPLKPIGACPHSRCRHHSQSVVAWGPDLAHYELVECDVDPGEGGCGGACRAWTDESSRSQSVHVGPFAQVRPISLTLRERLAAQ